MRGIVKRSVDELNRMDGEAFVETLGDVAEHSPWVAGAAVRQRPFKGRAGLVAAFERALREAPREAKLALLRAHPDLAGKLASAGNLTDDSRREQAGAGLAGLTEAERGRFLALNDRYRERFGFPFILAVKGATKGQILEAFEARIDSEAEIEFERALDQVVRIVRFRIEERVAE
jgi:2-oxo-4-hydroxy-4-carboxy-5-ureidoimidazoline decarboxylase